MTSALIAFGYTPREASFMELCATVSGYFVARQFDYFLGTRPGALTRAFLSRATKNGHVRFSVLSAFRGWAAGGAGPIRLAPRQRRRQPADGGRAALVFSLSEAL